MSDATIPTPPLEHPPRPPGIFSRLLCIARAVRALPRTVRAAFRAVMRLDQLTVRFTLGQGRACRKVSVVLSHGSQPK